MNDLRLVKNLKGLLKNHMGPDDEIENVETARLTQPGENYGSLMLRLDIQIKNTRTRTKKPLFLVAKTLPESEVFKKVFNVQTTFKNEIGIYTKVFPELEKFLKSVNPELSLDIVPKCFGGRVNLVEVENGRRNGLIVDDNACLLLENVKVQGFNTLPKKVGFNLEYAKLALDALTKFHAISLAFKLKEPQKFEECVKPYLADFTMSNDMECAAGLALEKVMKIYEFSSEVIEKTIANYHRTLDRKISKTPTEPWSCILHNDSWVNNILIKIDEAQHPQNVLLVDFQACEYKSPVRDVIFFLFTSVKVEVLKHHLDELLKHYFEKFTKFLEILNVDLKEFSWESYQEELRIAGQNYEFSHILMMLQPIFREATCDVNNADFRKNADNLYPFPSGVHLEKFLFCIEEFERRGWLYPC